MNKMVTPLTALAAMAIGVGAGGAAAYRYTRKKYDKLVQEEITSIKEMYRSKTAAYEATQRAGGEVQKTDSASDFTTVSKEDIGVQSLVDYAACIKDQGYDDSDEEDQVDVIELIPPEALGEKPGYEVISLTYYADGILADDENEMIGDVEGLIGADALGSFGTYEDDAVDVRNHAHKCDYEILRDKRTYADVIRGTSHMLEE